MFDTLWFYDLLSRVLLILFVPVCWQVLYDLLQIFNAIRKYELFQFKPQALIWYSLFALTIAWYW